MQRLALLALAACGGAPPQPETIRRPTEDKAAIAPPPPAPDVPMPGDPPKQTVENTDGKRTMEEVLRPATSFEIAALTGAPPSTKLVGSVLVWLDAPFYLSPKEGAPSLQLGKLPNRQDHVGEAVPMRVVSTKGAFVEVETPITDSLGNDVMDCAWFGLKTPHDVGRWRLFVKRADLAPVVAKKTAMTFSDGSRIEMEPGMPILPLADGKWLVGFHRVWVPAALPAGSFGFAYPTPPPPKEPRATDADEQLAETDKNNHVLKARTIGIAETEQPLRGAFAPLAVSVETKGNRVAFPVDDVCGKLTVMADPADVKAYEPSRPRDGSGWGGIGYGEAMGVEKWFIPRQTRLVAKDGSASTTASRDISVDKPASGAKQVCIERGPYISSAYVFGPEKQKVADAKVTLCVSARTVKHQKAGSPFGTGFGSGFGKGSGRGLGDIRRKPPTKE